MGIIKDLFYKISPKCVIKSNFFKENVYPYYHIVADGERPHISHLYDFKSKDEFIVDVDLLKSNYNPILLEDILKGEIKEKSFILTFDDGLREIYTNIYPILKKKGLSAIFFVNPDFVDNNQMMHKHRLSVLLYHILKFDYSDEVFGLIAQICGFRYANITHFKKEFMALKFDKEKELDEVFKVLNIDEKKYLQENKLYISKSEIQEMINDGFYFGGHTMSHRSLLTLPFEEQKNEIINSVEWLKDNFKIDYSLFAFPFSDRGVLLRLIKEVFEYDPNIILFGNSGIKKDVDARILQRFSLETPGKNTKKIVVMENLYMHYNKIIGKYKIKRD